ncbi:MAG: RluA family pseudouridine synthase [Treponema sp.]|nr:RluA family pseudouridine synthase [Treponema sp.]
MTLIAAGNDAGRRLDRILRKALPGIPLSALYRLFRKKAILVDGKPAFGADTVKAGSVIRIPGEFPNPPRGGREIPAGPDPERPYPETSSKKSSPPEILFEGSGLLVLNKPAGLAVHGPDRDNLNRWVQSYLEGRIPASLSFRPGPLHRLDKPTSGIVVFSTCLEGAKIFCKLLEEGKLVKTYLAVLEGNLEKEEVWNDSLFRDKKLRKSLAGPEPLSKKAVTRVRPAALSKGLTLALVAPETGRTHQIRSQAALHHFPLWGDRKYGGTGKGGFFLHALSLQFPPEEMPSLPRRITAPLPEAFSAFLRENFDGPATRPEKLQTLRL